VNLIRLTSFDSLWRYHNFAKRTFIAYAQNPIASSFLLYNREKRRSRRISDFASNLKDNSHVYIGTTRTSGYWEPTIGGTDRPGRRRWDLLL
jgi:hypothetical protein